MEKDNVVRVVFHGPNRGKRVRGPETPPDDSDALPPTLEKLGKNFDEAIKQAEKEYKPNLGKFVVRRETFDEPDDSA